MKKKSAVALLTATMVIGMTGAGCGDKQLALATVSNWGLNLIRMYQFM